MVFKDHTEMLKMEPQVEYQKICRHKETDDKALASNYSVRLVERIEPFL